MDIIMADNVFADKWPSVFSSWRRFEQKTISGINISDESLINKTR